VGNRRSVAVALWATPFVQTARIRRRFAQRSGYRFRPLAALGFPASAAVP
jgi:hypothetical protein